MAWGYIYDICYLSSDVEAAVAVKEGIGGFANNILQLGAPYLADLALGTRATDGGTTVLKRRGQYIHCDSCSGRYTYLYIGQSVDYYCFYRSRFHVSIEMMMIS